MEGWEKKKKKKVKNYAFIPQIKFFTLMHTCSQHWPTTHTPSQRTHPQVSGQRHIPISLLCPYFVLFSVTHSCSFCKENQIWVWQYYRVGLNCSVVPSDKKIGKSPNKNGYFLAFSVLKRKSFLNRQSPIFFIANQIYSLVT